MAKQLHEMSDDEISSLSATEIAALSAGEQANSNEEGEEHNEDESNTGEAENNDGESGEGEQEEVPADKQAQDADDEDADEGKQVPDNGAEAGKKVDEPSGEGKEAANKGADAEAGKADAKKATDAAVVPAEAQIAALFAPFKANGRDMKVESVEEARQLMQMGANYNKKMQGMKPHLTTLRMLDNAKIGDAELSFLIDLHRRDPAAINKLVKDSGIDPMDLTPEKADGYRPGNHKPSDAEVELDAVIQELDGSEHLPKTLGIVAKQWDTASKDVVAKHPQLLKLINQHVEAGFYDLINARVERERTFGRLTGLSDLEAYRQVGDAMAARGELAHNGGSATPAGQQVPAETVVTPDPKKADDSKRKDAKRAVAPVKGAAPSATQKPDFNPLSMSDEEFAKQFAGGKF